MAMQLKQYFLLTCLLIGSTVAQTDDDIGTALNSLPADLQGKVTEEQINTAKNQSMKAFKQMCEKNGGGDTYENVLKEFSSLTTCIQKLVDPKVIQKEIEDAKPNGTVDEVFKKYCDKTPSFKRCFYQFADAAQACVAEKERAHLTTVYNVTEQLADFVCFKNGDRIALFIAEGGPECFESKREAIQDCANQTMGGDFQGVNTNELSPDTISELPTLTFDENQCKKLTLLQKCVVSQLESCEQPTSANIVESLFKFARKATPCKKFQDPSEVKKNAAPAAVATWAVLMLALAASLA